MHDLSSFAYGLWPAVVLNVVFVLAFALSFFAPRKPVEWRSMGVLAAWLVALFTEMYGFPLTIYLLTTLLGQSYPVLKPFSHVNGHLLAVFLANGSPLVVALIDTVTSLVFFAGIIVMGAGWRQIHGSQGSLVTTGLYARVRHPQYTGLFIVIISMLVQWLSLSSLVMALALLVTYVRLARREERDMEEQFGAAYRVYKESIPAFFPRLLPRRFDMPVL